MRKLKLQKKDKEKILIVVAHPDDEILGFGGTGALAINRGEKVIPLILCGNVEERKLKPSEENLRSDMLNASKSLGFSEPIRGTFPNIKINTIPHIDLVRFIENYILEFRPNRIFTHHPSDLNDDHKQISNACMVASRIFQRNNEISPINGIYFMEILSSTEWSFNVENKIFSPNIFIDIKNSIKDKIAALRIYRDVMRPVPHPRSEEVISALSRFRGTQSGYEYAESFQQVFGNRL